MKRPPHILVVRRISRYEEVKHVQGLEKFHKLGRIVFYADYKRAYAIIRR